MKHVAKSIHSECVRHLLSSSNARTPKIPANYLITVYSTKCKWPFKQSKRTISRRGARANINVLNRGTLVAAFFFVHLSCIAHYSRLPGKMCGLCIIWYACNRWYFLIKFVAEYSVWATTTEAAARMSKKRGYWQGPEPKNTRMVYTPCTASTHTHSDEQTH